MNSIMWNRCFAIFDPEIETAQLASYFLVSKWAKGTALNAKQVKEVTAIKKTREEVLAEIREADEKRHALATELLKILKPEKLPSRTNLNGSRMKSQILFIAFTIRASR